ncbi:MAG: energy transducer TonB [Bacteroidales bacterium]|nr:energy transducer TonB [Lentimicrobiaceae bacterium]MBQ2906828.1 energy transducer TonB [Bacteroidales bacterium]MBQ3595832.1 energy transducer TonB [Bacteroidales bacterium]
MEIKKSPKADLESKKLTFTLIGLVVTLFVVWRVFEYKSYDKQTIDDLQRTVEVIEEEMVEITKQEQPKVQPPQPKPQVTQIQVVEDDVEVEDEIDINAEVDQDEVIEEYEFTPPEIEEEEIVEAEIFKVVEEMPEFPGGSAKLMEYIQKNIKYPMMARESDIQGRVFVNFVVEPDGSISNVAVLRGIGGGCDEEAVRVVNSMPKWKPGKQRGSAVRCAYTVPIIFKLQ